MSSSHLSYVPNESGFVVGHGDRPKEATQEIIVAVYRWVVFGILVSLFWKASVYPSVLSGYRVLRLTDPFFPDFLRDNATLVSLMLVPGSFSLVAIFVNQVWLFRIQSITMTLAMAGFCWHQGSYNDVTFLTCFWTSLWTVWLTFSMDQPIEKLLPKAQTFAVLILSMIFLGGAVGKLTPGYWSGEVFYQIYFVDRDFWFFNLLRRQFDDASLRSFATGYSRMVVIVELSCAFLWLLPTRIASMIALTTLLGIALFSNFNLFSVMSCLIGLCLVGLYRPPFSDRTSL